MKKYKSILCASLSAVMVRSAVPFAALAEDNMVYGTIEKLYAEFYANECVAYLSVCEG